MKFYHLLIFLTGLLFSGSIARSQDAPRPMHFKEIGWSITIPPGFTILDSATNAAMSNRGAKAMEDANDIKADISGTVTLFGAKKTDGSYFNSTITPYNVETDGDYSQSLNTLKGIIYNTMLESLTDAKLDSFSAKVLIHHQYFEKFILTVNIDNKVLFTMVLICCHYRGYDFGITYIYRDEKTMKEIEASINESRFTN